MTEPTQHQIEWFFSGAKSDYIGVHTEGKGEQPAFLLQVNAVNRNGETHSSSMVITPEALHNLCAFLQETLHDQGYAAPVPTHAGSQVRH